MATAEPALLDRVRETLEQELRPVVDQLVDEVVAGLVRERVGALNGATKPELELDPPAPGTKLCRDCGEEKPVSAFEKGRRQCRSCRHKDHLERVARKAENGTAPEVVAQSPLAAV